MRIKMLMTKRGSPDGKHTELYELDAEYDMSTDFRSRDLAAAFIRYGWAKEVKPAVVVKALAEVALKPSAETLTAPIVTTSAMDDAPKRELPSVVEPPVAPAAVEPPVVEPPPVKKEYKPYTPKTHGRNKP